MKLFDEMEIPYLVKWADDKSHRLVSLLWMFPYCIQMWKRFPEVVSFDNTYNMYNANRYKLPFIRQQDRPASEPFSMQHSGYLNTRGRRDSCFLPKARGN